MEIELQQFGSVPIQERYTFAQHLEQTMTTATIMVACQETDTQMFKSDKHGILNLMYTNISSQLMEKLDEQLQIQELKCLKM